MPDAFISYSRKNIAFARLLIDSLEKNDLHVWIDWQDIPPSADWLAEVYEAIENSDSFIFIISENSVISEVCSLEIAHAVRNNKRMIPIVVNSVDPGKVPKPLVDLQWIFFTQEDQYGNALQDLIKAIQTDQAWVKAHTRLQNRALEWERRGRAGSTLLRGTDLNRAEDWLSQAAEKDPPPTVLQTDFIFASRQAANRRQRIRMGAVGAGIVVAVSLGLWAWMQRVEAVQTTQARSTTEAVALEEAHTRATAEVEAIQEERGKATAQAELEDQIQTVSARFLAAQSRSKRGENLDLGLLLALEGLHLEDNLKTREALLRALTAHPYLQSMMLRSPDLFIEEMLIDPTGKLVARNYQEPKLYIFDLEQRGLVQTVDTPSVLRNVEHPLIEGALRYGVRYNADGTLMISYSNRAWMLWDTASYTPLGNPFPESVDSQAVANIVSISPTFDLVASLEEEEIRVWERWDGKLLQTFSVPDTALLDLPCFNVDETMFIVPYEGPAIHFYDMDTGELVLNIDIEGDLGDLQTYELSPQGNRLGVIGSDLILLYDTNTGEVIDRYQRAEDTEYKLLFDKQEEAYLLYRRMIRNSVVPRVINDDYIFLETMGENRLLLNRFSPWRGNWTFPSYFHYQALNPMIRINPQTFQYISHFRNEGITELTLYDPLRITPILESLVLPLGEKEPVLSRVSARPADDQTMAVEQCSQDTPEKTCSLAIWDFNQERPEMNLIRTDISPSQAFTFHPGGELLAIVDDENVLSIWEWQRNEVVWSFEDLPENVDLLDFSPTGKYLAAASSRGRTISVLNTETGAVMQQMGTDSGGVAEIAFHPLHPLLGVADGEGITLWDLEKKVEITRIGGEEPLEVYQVLAFHPNGSQLVSGGADGWVYWNLDTYQEVTSSREQPMHQVGVDYLSFDPTGRWMVSGHGLVFQLHDADSGKWVGDLSPIDPQVPESALAVSRLPDPSLFADGTRLAAYSRRDQVQFWQLDLASWKRAACQMANRSLTDHEWKTYLGDVPYRETCP